MVASAASPGDVLQVDVQIDGAGKLGYDIERRGKEIIGLSRLGFNLVNAPKLDGGFSLRAQKTSEHDDTWEQPWGERRSVRNHYRELRVDLEQKNRAGRAMAIVFRIYDDGVGFRYEFPSQPQLRDTQILDELTEFAVAQPATAWWIPAGELPGLEEQVQRRRWRKSAPPTPR